VCLVLVTAGASGGALNAPWTGTMSYQFTSDGFPGTDNYAFDKIEGSMTVKLGPPRSDGTQPYKATFTGHTKLTHKSLDSPPCGRSGYIVSATYTNQPGTAMYYGMYFGATTNGQLVWEVTPDPPTVGGDSKSTFVVTPTGKVPGGNGCVDYDPGGPLSTPSDVTNLRCVVPLHGFTTKTTRDDDWLAKETRVVGRFAHSGRPILYCTRGSGDPDLSTYSMTAAYNLVRSGDAAGVPAATAFTDTFSAAGQAKPHAVTVPAGKTKAEITLRWTKPGDRFTIADVVLVPKRKTASVARAEKLKITFFSLTPTSMGVRIGNLAPGKLTFRVVSKKQNGTTTVRTRVILKA